MKRGVMMAAVLAMAAGWAAAEGEGTAPAGAEGRRGGPGDPEARFKMMDANGNGTIEKDEFRGPAEFFDRVDADKSGTLTLEELREFHRRQMENRGDPEARFKMMDKNGNGAIEKDEFGGPAEFFDRVDADKSGTLTLEELREFHRRQMENRGDPEARFKMMDKNGNGTIEKDEFRGPAEFFDRVDADKSGTLTLGELQAARAARMGRPGPAPRSEDAPAPAENPKPE